LIQTRWHEDDLVGWLSREHADEHWRVINAPSARGNGRPDRSCRAEPLWFEKYRAKVLERIRSAIGSAAWISQYQQRSRRRKKARSGAPEGCRKTAEFWI